jgi:hypothetical protein
LDRLREELAIQKQLFFAALAIMFGLTGWIVVNADRYWLVLAAGALAVVFSGVFGYSRYKRMNQLLEEIENA